MAGNHAIAWNCFFGHVKISATVLDKYVPFLETVLVKQHTDTFAGRQLAFGMLRLDTLLTAALLCRQTSPL